MQHHMQNVGRMVDNMEIKVCNLLHDVYFSNMRDVVISGIRTILKKRGDSKSFRRSWLALSRPDK